MKMRYLLNSVNTRLQSDLINIDHKNFNYKIER